MTPHATPPGVGWPSDDRRRALEAWFARLDPALGLQARSLRPAPAGAGLGRHLRVDAAGGPLLVLDAPPSLEGVRPFVQVAGLARAAGLNVPDVLAADEAQGFVLMSDLGDEAVADALRDPACAEGLMRDGIAALVQWQARVPFDGLRPFDEARLRDELALFPQWCVQKAFGRQWSATEERHWQRVCDALVSSAREQPRVAVHADWTPRNLMACPGRGLGIMGFQQAASGPVTYDIASWLRDDLIRWDEEQEIDWAVRYWEAARQAGLPVAADFGEFWRQLEWMGLQRHLKVLGIFCRLKHRDGKPKYSEDLPRFFAYAHKVATRYNGLGPLARLLEPLMGTDRIEAFY